MVSVVREFSISGVSGRYGCGIRVSSCVDLELS